MAAGLRLLLKGERGADDCFVGASAFTEGSGLLRLLLSNGDMRAARLLSVSKESAQLSKLCTLVVTASANASPIAQITCSGCRGGCSRRDMLCFSAAGPTYAAAANAMRDRDVSRMEMRCDSRMQLRMRHFFKSNTRTIFVECTRAHT